MQSHVKSAHRMGTPIHGEVDPTVKKQPCLISKQYAHTTKRASMRKQKTYRFLWVPYRFSRFHAQPTSDAHSNTYLISANFDGISHVAIYIIIYTIIYSLFWKVTDSAGWSFKSCPTGNSKIFSVNPKKIGKTSNFNLYNNYVYGHVRYDRGLPNFCGALDLWETWPGPPQNIDEIAPQNGLEKSRILPGQDIYQIVGWTSIPLGKLGKWP